MPKLKYHLRRYLHRTPPHQAALYRRLGIYTPEPPKKPATTADEDTLNAINTLIRVVQSQEQKKK